MSNVEAGRRVVAILGERGARELLDVLTRPEAERAELIGRLYARDDMQVLAETLMELEDVPLGEIARLRLLDGLRQVLG